MRALVLLVVAGCSSARTEGTMPPPGSDPSHFAPVESLAAVATFAGAGAVLDEMTLDGVHEDGTVDLRASYPSYAMYTFSVPAASPADRPVGAGGFQGPGHRRVMVDVRRPDSMVAVTTNGHTHTYTNLGMDKREDSPSAGAVPATAAPTCAPAALWKAARAQGAPAGAVASMRFERGGGSFWISGTAVNLRFDASCVPGSPAAVPAAAVPAAPEPMPEVAPAPR